MPQIPSDSEQRSYPRIPKEAQVTLTELEYPPATDGERPGVLVNIASGGIRLATDHAYETGTRLSLKINLKGWRRHLKSVVAIIDDSANTIATNPLTAIVEVVWSTPLPDSEHYEIGVKFLDIYEDEYNALKKYLENLAHYSAGKPG